MVETAPSLRTKHEGWGVENASFHNFVLKYILMPSLSVSMLNHANFKIIRLVYHNLNFLKIVFIVIFGIYMYVEQALCAASYAKSVATRGGGGGGGYSHFFLHT